MSQPHDLAEQLSEIINQPNDVQSRVSQHIAEAKLKRKKEVEQEQLAARKAASEARKKSEASAPLPKDEAPAAPKQEKKFRNMVYLGYSYAAIPGYIAAFKKAVQDLGYLVFDPLAAVEEQFDEEHKESLFALKSRVSPTVLRVLKMPEAILSPLETPQVIEGLRQGDGKFDTESMMFKELFFLVRSNVMVCDLSDSQSPDLFHKLFAAKSFDLPVIGIAPRGRALSPYLQRYVRVLLTDEFNQENIEPLIKAYSPL